jgi:hypothetical protein
MGKLVAHKNVLESKDISRSHLRRESTTISKGEKLQPCMI